VPAIELINLDISFNKLSILLFSSLSLITYGLLYTKKENVENDKLKKIPAIATNDLKT
jgi:hypothetical protein